MPSKERARSPIWSRDFDWIRTEKSPRATAPAARVSRLTLRASDPTSDERDRQGDEVHDEEDSGDRHERDPEGPVNVGDALREELLGREGAARLWP